MKAKLRLKPGIEIGKLLAGDYGRQHFCLINKCKEPTAVGGVHRGYWRLRDANDRYLKEPPFCHEHADALDVEIARREYSDLVSNFRRLGIAEEPRVAGIGANEKICCFPGCTEDVTENMELVPYMPDACAQACGAHAAVITDVKLKQNAKRVLRELETAKRPAGRAAAALAADRKFERMAIAEAKKSIAEDKRVHPKVGAVVVKRGKVVATAHRGETPKCHAEYIALEKKRAKDALVGATVYTTLEPCTHRGDPKVPCAERLIEREVRRVVIGMLDPNPEVHGKGIERLAKAGIGVVLFEPKLQKLVRELNRDFTRMWEKKAGKGRLAGNAEAASKAGSAGRKHAANVISAERPWLVVEPVPSKISTPNGIAWFKPSGVVFGQGEMAAGEHHKPEAIGYTIANCGRSPGTVTAHWSTVHFVGPKGQLPSPPPYFEDHVQDSGDFLKWVVLHNVPRCNEIYAPGRSRITELPFHPGDSRVVDAARRQLSLYVFGIIRYMDVFKREYETRFCFRWYVPTDAADPKPQGWDPDQAEEYSRVT